MIILESRSALLLPEYKEIAGNEDAVSRTWGKKSKIFLCLYTVVSIAALLRNNPLDGVRFQLCWILGQAIMYVGLFRRVARLNRLQDENVDESFHTSVELASIMAVGTGVLVLILWQSPPSLPEIGLVGAVKACRWMSLLILVNQ